MATDLTLALTGDNHVDAAVPPATPSTALEIGYTGNETTVPNVIITLLEIDEGEGLGQKKRSAPSSARPKGDLIAEFTCKIDGGALSLVNPTPKTPSLPAASPLVRVKLAGKTFDLKLPGAGQENGLFEIRVIAETKANSPRPEYVSDWLAFARHFTAFPRPPGIKGAVLAFVTGMDDAKFFAAAAEYWKFHADAVFVKDGLSLEEIVTFLADHEDDFGGYGEINIVTHGNRISALIRLVQGGERELRISRMEEAFGNAAVADKFAAAGSMGLGADSRVVFRACNIGNRPDLLKVVREKVFNDACPVFAPKFLQSYDANGPKPIEFFTEDLAFFSASSSAPSAADEEAKIRARFASAHPSLKFDDERDTFEVSARKHKAVTDSFPMTLSEELLIDFTTGNKRSAADLDKLSGQEFDRISAADDSRDFTTFSQWEAGARKNEKRQPSSSDGVWVEPSGSGHRPTGDFINAGGELVLGADSSFGQGPAPDTAPGDMRLSGSKVADRHVRIQYAGKLALEVTGEPRSDGTPESFGAGGKTVTSFKGKAPLSIKVGSVSVPIRQLQELTFEVPLTRFHVSWRRTLRIDASAADYSKRTMVVPVVTNSSHFGSSNDPAPSRTALEALSK